MRSSKKPSVHTRKQVSALKLAIQALTYLRRQRYAAGEAAYQKGVDFTFATYGHKHYLEYTHAMDELDDLIEILTDKGVTHEPVTSDPDQDAG